MVQSIPTALDKRLGAKLWNLNPDDLTDRMPVFLPDVPEVREDMADYIGEVLALDLMLHCFMEELEKAGELDNTVVIATGDNGPPGFTVEKPTAMALPYEHRC